MALFASEGSLSSLLCRSVSQTALTLPLSITYRTFGMVIDVSAMFVEMMHFRTPFD